ncbi:MAG: hypothetical protein CL840_14385 [Crocinitomicaceae bacterium]|nr:hypothetical protein [Crocinitomicaceae bacterium]
MWKKVFKNQTWPFIVLGISLAVCYISIDQQTQLLRGELWGIPTLWWYVFAFLSPIIHQLYVLICWRLELHYQAISNRFGKNGFKLFKVGFALLILSRPLLIVLLAISNANTFTINPTLSLALSILFLIPSVYLFYSVVKYFGMDRAFGIDHFQPQHYAKQPLVNQGIFKYTSNGMYYFGFLVLWIPGILLQSQAALLIALFNHLYIWVHYYFTELPDIEEIYGKD